jgi:hypothetical protein
VPVNKRNIVRVAPLRPPFSSFSPLPPTLSSSAHRNPGQEVSPVRVAWLHAVSHGQSFSPYSIAVLLSQSLPHRMGRSWGIEHTSNGSFCCQPLAVFTLLQKKLQMMAVVHGGMHSHGSTVLVSQTQPIVRCNKTAGRVASCPRARTPDLREVAATLSFGDFPDPNFAACGCSIGTRRHGMGVGRHQRRRRPPKPVSHMRVPITASIRPRASLPPREEVG